MNTITKEQMAELDRIMIEDFGIDVPIMMEHAGMAVAMLADKMCAGRKILILCGHGNNGGDGLAAARHIANWGYDVSVLLASPENKLKTDPLKQYNILRKMKLPFITSDVDFSTFNLIIDALLGYNIEGNPRGLFAEIINKANQSDSKILAVDLPSGLDATSGSPANPCIKATTTVALTMPKTGLVQDPAKPFVGKLYASYMSVPQAVYDKLKIKSPFPGSSVLVELTENIIS